MDTRPVSVHPDFFEISSDPSAAAVWTIIIISRSRRYNVNKYRIKLKKLVIYNKNWSEKEQLLKGTALKLYTDNQGIAPVLEDELQLLECILPDHGFIMFLKVGFACGVSGQLLSIF